MLERTIQFELGERAEDGTRSYSAVLSTESPVMRTDVHGTEYAEVLRHTEDAIDFSRFPLPLIESHNGRSLPLGVLEKPRIDGDKLRVFARFGKSTRAREVETDVDGGIIRSLSVGYSIDDHEDKKMPGGSIVRTAVRWTPHEGSLVAMPADNGAGFGRNEEMPEINTPEEVKVPEERAAPVAAPAPVAPVVDAEKVRVAERTRAQEILKLSRSANLGDEFADAQIEAGASVEQARSAALDAVLARSAKIQKPDGVNVSASRDIGVESFRSGVANYFEHRADSRVELTEPARQFRGMSLLEIAKESLQSRGVSTRGMGKNEIAGLALRDHSTSDFPHILADVANKTIRKEYTERVQTFEPLVRRVSLPDFKSVNRKQLGDAPVLVEIVEGGEYSRGTVSEGGVSYQLSTYGKMIGFTRRMLINDDLDAFMRINSMFTRRARELEGDLVWAQITDSGVLMGDGLALFNAAHNNTGSGVIAVAGIGAGEEAMGLQEGIDGGKINIEAKYLLVPRSRKTLARQFLAQTNPTQASEVNPFAGELQIISDSRLDAASTAQWYLAADPGQIDMIELGFLEGSEGPFLDSETNFNTDGLSMKIRHEVVARVIDHKGFYRSSGS